jgi:hypothetical protein
MPYVNVPNDLSKIKTKMAFNLTKRQLICFGGAAAIVLPAGPGATRKYRSHVLNAGRHAPGVPAGDV